MPVKPEASFKEFARIYGCKPGWVTELRKQGRLVLTEDKKRVRVDESLALIKATRDPSKAGVAERHAAARGAALASDAPAAQASAPTSAPEAPAAAAAADDDELPLPPNNPHADRRAKALADKEEALARKAHRDELLELNELRRASDIEPAIAEAGARLRAGFESMPYDLAPELAAITDEGEIRAKLAEYVEAQLADLARTFDRIARGVVE